MRKDSAWGLPISHPHTSAPHIPPPRTARPRSPRLDDAVRLLQAQSLRLPRNVVRSTRPLRAPYWRGIPCLSSDVVSLRTQNDGKRPRAPIIRRGRCPRQRSASSKPPPAFEEQRPHARAPDNGAIRPVPISDDIPARIRRLCTLPRWVKTQAPSVAPPIRRETLPGTLTRSRQPRRHRSLCGCAHMSSTRLP
ncbi:hypothetical protein C8J57DRAFT_1531432 [Mycena rebaudengoi]|nr:hypothetical protein C8J57DRAFT_1531432 [Mycena rebaudengoi]